jgi:cobalamin synthase
LAPCPALPTATQQIMTTTVLPTGTVESRGIGVYDTCDASSTATNGTTPSTSAAATTRLRVHADIEAFVKAPFSVGTEVRGFFTVWTFVTRLPGPTYVDHHPGYLMKGMVYFPLNGTLIGMFVAIWYNVAHISWQLSASVAACVSMAVGCYVTGCFHEDGLGDAADGFGGGWSRSQVLKIMTDTRLGTFGCVALLLYLVSIMALLTSLDDSNTVMAPDSDTRGSWTNASRALVVAHTLSRLTPTIMIHCFPYVEDDGGPKNPFYSFMVHAQRLVSTERVAMAILYSLGVAVSVYQSILLGLCLVVTVGMVAMVAGRYSTFMIGGVMGDVLGAVICGTQVVLLLIVASLTTRTRQWGATETWDARVWTVLVEHYEEYKNTNWTRILTLWTSNGGWFERVLSAAMTPSGIATLQWISLLAATALWCATVGHPSVYVREEAVDKNQPVSNDDQSSNSPTSNPLQTSNPQCPSRQAAQAILQSPSSTFDECYHAAQTYLDALAKPVGSLGTVEDWAARLAACQKTTFVTIDPVACLILAADHGVAAADTGESASAFPQAVTRSILRGLQRNIAGASVLARSNGVAVVRVVDVGVLGEPFVLDAAQKNSITVVVSAEDKIVGGTRNFCQQSALTMAETERCIQMGRNQVEHLVQNTGCKVLVLGEVGIGNTTTASALVAV